MFVKDKKGNWYFLRPINHRGYFRVICCCCCFVFLRPINHEGYFRVIRHKTRLSRNGFQEREPFGFASQMVLTVMVTIADCQLGRENGVTGPAPNYRSFSRPKPLTPDNAAAVHYIRMIITGSPQTSCYLRRHRCPGSFGTFAYRFAWARVERMTWQSSVAGRPRGEAGAPIPGHPEPAQ